jgi:hypothetical protein
MRSNNRTNLQNKTSSRAVDSKVIKSSNRKPEASNSNNISSKTIPQNNSNEPKDSRINSDSNRSNTPVGSRINNGNSKTIPQNNSNESKGSRISSASNGNSKTIPQDSSNKSKGSRINSDSNRSNKPEGNTINNASNSNNTTTGLHNNAVPLKYINNRLLGRGIVPGTGSLITEHGNNAAAIAVTVFLTTVSVPPMARITDSAFIVFR